MRGFPPAFTVAAGWLARACEGHPNETVREYFELVRPRINEVVAEHAVDLALRWKMKVAMGRPAAMSSIMVLRRSRPSVR